MKDWKAKDEEWKTCRKEGKPQRGKYIARNICRKEKIKNRTNIERKRHREEKCQRNGSRKEISRKENIQNDNDVKEICKKKKMQRGRYV